MPAHDPQIARQRRVLSLLTLAGREYPEAGWDRLVRLTVQFGAGSEQPIKAAEVRALHDVRIGDLFDPPKCRTCADTHQVVYLGDHDREPWRPGSYADGVVQPCPDCNPDQRGEPTR